MTRPCQACGKAALVPDEIKPKGRKCRECIRQSRNAYNREYQKTYYPEHRAETLKRARRYRRAHRAQIRKRQREYAEEHREESRERARRWYQENKARHNARVAAWKAAHPGAQAEYQRAHYAKQRLDPKAWARYLEESRMKERLRAEQLGKPLPMLSERQYIARYGTGFGRATSVSTEPIRPYVEVWAARIGPTEIERLAPVAAKRIAELLYGQPVISLVTADRLCTLMGVPMSMLYQDADQDAA
jgi:hypothetical protein